MDKGNLVTLIKELFILMNILMLTKCFIKCEFMLTTKRVIVYLASFFTIEYILLTNFQYSKFLIITIVVQFIYFLIIPNLNLSKKITMFTFCIIIDAFFEIVIEQVFIVNGFTHPLNLTIMLNKVITLIFIITILLISNHSPVNKIKFYTIDQTHIFLYLSVGFFSAFIMLILVSLNSDILTDLMILFIILVMVLTIVSSTLVTLQYIKKNNENFIIKDKIFLKNKMLNVHEESFNTILESYDELKSFRHDINGYFTTIQHLIIAGEYEKLLSLVNRLEAHSKKSHVLVCSNIFVASVVNYFYNYCKKENIVFNFDYQVVDELTMESDHICSLFYNLLSNAVEACVHVKGEKVVSLFIRNKGSTLIVEIENAIDSDFKLKNIEHFISTKGGEHKGLGLRNINKIINFYRGRCEYLDKGNKLKCTIILLSVVKTDTSGF